MNIFELTVKAEVEFSINLTDGLRQWTAAIDPVLSAAGLCRIGSDEIECLYLTEDWLHITTEFFGQGCCSLNAINIPLYILKANDPIREATIYRVQQKLLEAKKELATSQTRVRVCTKRVAELEKELEALM